MTCTKCGTNNIDGSSFCIKCGSNLNVLQETESVNEVPVQTEQNNNFQQQSIEQPINGQQPYYDQSQQNNQQQPVQQPINGQQPYYNQSQNNYNQSVIATNANTNPLNYLMFIVAILLKPFKSFKEEETKLDNSKTSFVFALIVIGIMTVVNLINTIFSKVHVASFSWSSGNTYSWKWENLKEIKWLEVIGKNFLIYACIIFLIVIVFYLGSLIVKKPLSFIKSLSISTISVIPFAVCVMILSPLLGMIWSPLSIVFIVVGVIYSLIILYELMNEKLGLEGDKKIYFNLVCLIVLTFAVSFVYISFFISEATSELDKVMNIF